MWSMYTQIYSGRKFQFSPSFCSVSVHGECFPQKRRAYSSKVKKCVLWSISNIFLHLVHLVPPLLSSSWLVTSKQEEREMIISATNVYREQQNQPIFNSFVLLTQMQARWHLFGDNLSHKLPFQFSIYALLYYKLFRFIHLSVLSGDLSGPVGLPQTPYAVTST